MIASFVAEGVTFEIHNHFQFCRGCHRMFVRKPGMWMAPPPCFKGPAVGILMLMVTCPDCKKAAEPASVQTLQQ